MTRRMLVGLVIGWALGVALTLMAVRTTAAQDNQFDLNATLLAAQPGDVITVPPGVYPAPLTIDKAVTLEGKDWPVIEGDGSGDVVKITAPGVTLRGFVVRGTGISLDREDSAIHVTAADATIENNRVEDALFGIYLANAPRSVVRNNLVLAKDLPISRRGDSIKVWYSADSLIDGNTVRSGRDSVVWFSPGVVVRNNLIEDSRYGLHFMQTNDHVVENNILRNNSVGIYLMYGDRYIVRNNLLYNNRGASGYGLGAKEINDLTVEGNHFIANRVGLYNDSSPVNPKAIVDFNHNLLAYNELGMSMLPNVKHNSITENIFLENTEQVNIAGSGDLTGNQWAIDGRGNYWSDYNGFDADGNQVGDLPYQSRSLYESLIATYPDLRLFQLSPATDALDLAAKAFPIFAPRPILADDFPLMKPPAIPVVPGLQTPSRFGALLAALGMIAIGALVLLVGVGGRWKLDVRSRRSEVGGENVHPTSSF
jgi:nitrous oxidase accessory protein